MDKSQMSLEEQIAVVWAETLGIEQVGPTDDFLELGGNSLHAVQIIGRTEEIFDVDLSVRSVLESRNVHDMARHVEQALAASAVPGYNGELDFRPGTAHYKFPSWAQMCC